MLKCDALLDLVEFCKDPGIALVAVSMQLGKSRETKVMLSMVNQPTGRLEYGQQLSLSGEGPQVTSGKNMIKNPRKTAGTICRPKGTCHWALLEGSNPIYVPYEIQAAHSAPTPSMNCCRPVTRPRISGWQISAWYKGTIMTRKPTLMTRSISARIFALALKLSYSPKSSQKSSTVQIIHCLRSCLESTTKTEDYTADNDSPSTTDHVTTWPSESCTEESTSCEQRHDQSTGTVH